MNSVWNRSRRGVAAAALMAVVGMVGGCAGSSPSAESAEGKGTELTVYSPQGDGKRGDYIAQQAKKALGLDITFVSGGGGELTERLIGEKNNPQADVALGLGQSLLYQLDDKGVLEPSTPSWRADVPEQFTLDTDTFTLFSQTPIVMAYNAKALTADKAPTSWVDLADEQWKGKFTFPNVESQTGQAAVVGILWRYADKRTGEVNDEGWSTLKAILKNAVPVPDGQAFDWAPVARGTHPVVIDWLGGVQTGAADNGLDLQLVNAEGGSPFVSAGVGVVKGTKQTDNAKKFIDWFGSADVQAAFVQATGSDTPVLPRALEKLPKDAATLKGITKQDIDWSVASTQLAGWLERIQLDILG